MQYIKQLYTLHEEFNAADFDGQLHPIRVLIKRNPRKWGWYEYKAHKDWRPVRKSLWKATITITDGCWDEEGTTDDDLYGTMLHEMIHQWQCEILDEAPHHNDVFKAKATELSKKYGVEV
jgi:hypothetical protein